MTLSSFLGKRFKDPTNSLRLISSIITLLFFTVYAASGLVGAGKLFESMFNIDYTTLSKSKQTLEKLCSADLGLTMTYENIGSRVL